MKRNFSKGRNGKIFSQRNGKKIQRNKKIFLKMRRNLQKTRYYSKKTKKFLQIKIKDEIFNDT